jgi:putative ABC transport system ATP-binding protein
VARKEEVMSILSVKNLSKSFYPKGKELVVFNDITFDISLGEVLLIAGRSGVGKSTLLSVLSGLDVPTSGTVHFDEQMITEFSLDQLASLRAEKIGMIFQSFNLIPTWTALENVESVLMHRGLPTAERQARATEVLERLGLKNRLHNLPVELSVGQQQRVAIARTLVNNPVLILADEPTGDVDEETAQEIMELLLEPVKAKKAALLVVSHGAFDAKYADRTLRLQEGTLIDRAGASHG